MPAPYERHRAQLKAILLASGMPKDNAEATADILGWADLHGVDGHGISMLPVLMAGDPQWSPAAKRVQKSTHAARNLQSGCIAV